MKEVDSSLLVRLHRSKKSYTEAFKIAYARLTCLCLYYGAMSNFAVEKFLGVEKVTVFI